MPRSRNCSERSEQAVVVARVQADGRFVQYVEHAAKPRTDLRGEANALCFAAGERGGGAVQAEIAETNREQEVEPLGDFTQGTAGDVALPRGKSASHAVDGGPRFADCQSREIGDGKAGNLTARLSGRKRRPPQAAQVDADIYCVSHSR